MTNFDDALLALSHDIARQASPKTDKTCRISVVIPCYNSTDYIRPCLESLAGQTLPLSDFEIICIDDCSTDGTYELLQSWSEKLPNLRILRHDVNKKQGGARNTGLKIAEGEFITFVDSDDFLRADALEILLSHAAQDTDVVAAHFLRVRYDRDYQSNPITRKLSGTKEESTLLNTLGWFPMGLLIRSDLIKKNNLYFEEGVSFEDIEFCIRLFMDARDVRIVNEKVYYYVQRDGSTVNSITKEKLADSANAMARVFDRIAGSKKYTDIFRKTSISWLKLQASRTRDSGLDAATRQILGKYLVSELKARGVDKYLTAAELTDLVTIASGAPKKPKAAAAAIGQKTSRSPWGGLLEERFSDKVVFFCEVDYHIRSAAAVVRALKDRGISSIIVDASKSTSFSTNRPLPEEERALYSDLDLVEFNVANVLPFSTKARAFVFMNDLTYTKNLILENFGFGVPTFGFYEGINDDWNLDRQATRRPYRSLDYLLLPGIYQQGFYADRASAVVGLPNVRSRLIAPFKAAEKTRAVINVNFTYGVLEDQRDLYVQTAVQACLDIGLDYVISQHPADKGDLSAYNVSGDSIYDLLDEGGILISRFSTTILESLASGRPAIYHNPIQELVPKFKHPLGAFRCTDSKPSLKSALSEELAFLKSGGDIRARAALFLHFHAHTGAVEEPEIRAADYIVQMLKERPHGYQFKSGNAGAVERKPSPVLAQSSSDDLDLSRLAAELVLNPAQGRAQLLQLGARVDQHVARLPADDPLRQHFLRARDFAMT